MFNEIWHILKGAVPSDPITPFITGNTIQVLFMAIVTAVIISFLSHKHKDIIMKPITSLQHIVLKILSIFMWFSPIAAFSAMAYLIGHFGLYAMGHDKLASCYAIFLLFIYFWNTWHHLLLCKS